MFTYTTESSNFVQNFLGVNYINPNQALGHQTICSRTLFSWNVALILAGTYYFIQKHMMRSESVRGNSIKRFG